HTWCQDCLVKAFDTAMTETLQFPPRCCGTNVEIHRCYSLLPKELMRRFEAKVEETATPNPTYCSNTKCGSFVRAQSIKGLTATCGDCGVETCVTCKGKKHNGLCPKDPNTQLLLDTAKTAKWKQCPHCNNMVELRSGCFHITCRCKYEFCYTCVKKWKTCRCSLWQENRLI
ncbi:hypothetical protein BDV96DRAFT_450248, partial [Lophiotrema nucula]